MKETKLQSFTKFLLIFIILMSSAMFSAPAAYSGQSTITESEGYACMGDDKSRKQTETEALANARRKAAEYAATFIKSETRVKDLQLEKDLIDAYSNASVKIVQEIEKAWYKDPASGECFKIKIKAEVIPDEKMMAQIAKEPMVADDPNGPLNVRLWTDKKEYKQSEKIKIYLKGNKPFYARVLYRDVRGNLLQLLPNSYRTDNYFNGGVIYEIPSGNDRYELEVSPPFGEENIILYAGSSPLGDINLRDAGGFYQVRTASKDVGKRTRGVKLKEKGDAAESAASEFYENKAVLRTQSSR